MTPMLKSSNQSITPRSNFIALQERNIMNSSPHRAANTATAATPPMNHCALPVTIAMPPVLTLEVLTPAGVVGVGPVANTTLVVVIGPGVIVEEDEAVELELEKE